MRKGRGKRPWACKDRTTRHHQRRGSRADKRHGRALPITPSDTWPRVMPTEKRLFVTSSLALRSGNTIKKNKTVRYTRKTDPRHCEPAQWKRKQNVRIWEINKYIFLTILNFKLIHLVTCKQFVGVFFVLLIL